MRAINKPAAAISALILITSLSACGSEAEQLPPVPPEAATAETGSDIDKAAEDAMGAAEEAADASTASDAGADAEQTGQ